MRQLNNRILIAWALSLAALIAMTIPARACSPLNKDIFPTNFEMVADVDAIVIAKVEGEENGEVIFSVSKVLKGSAPEVFRDQWARLGETRSSGEKELIRPHPDSYGNNCRRGVFEQNAEYVLFLTEDEKRGWRHGQYLSSRTAENFYGMESLWVKTIQYYLDVQQGRSPLEQLEMLGSDYVEFSSADPESDEVILAVDIAFHLQQITRWKPFEYLVETYEALLQGQERPYVVENGERLQNTIITEDDNFLFLRRIQFDWGEDFSRFFILRSMELGKYEQTKSFVSNIVESQPVPHEYEVGQIVRLLFASAYFEEAMNFAEANAFRVIMTGDRFSAFEIIRAMRLKGYGMEYGLSISSQMNAFRKRWPELLLSIDTAWVHRFDRPSEVLTEDDILILISDEPRRRPDVLRALARAKSKIAIGWALKEIDVYLIEDITGYELWYLKLPIDVLLHSYSSFDEERRSRIDRLFCRNEQVRSKLISRLGLYPTGDIQDLAVRIANFEGLSKEEVDQLRRTLATFVAVEYKVRGNGWNTVFYPRRSMETLEEYRETGKVSLEDYELRSRASITCP